MNVFFEQFPEFVLGDTRKDRGFSPVTPETLTNRHEASLPPNLVKGKTILDLGSCLGASGHWCLTHGATHYTGVEAQPKMVETSKEILGKYWTPDTHTIVQQDLVSFLDEAERIGVKYDVVIMIGVIYAFLDTYNILKKATAVCKEVLLIDCLYPHGIPDPDAPVTIITRLQNINSSEENTAFYGMGCRVTPKAMRMMMDTLGFKDREGIIQPKPLSDKTIHDTYVTLLQRNNFQLPARYMLRFVPSSSARPRIVGEAVASSDLSSKMPMPAAPTNLVKADTWVFDESVANRFQQEATNHIPDYERVINMCISYVDKAFSGNKDVRIIDVGSALGHTLDKFISAGYNNVYGVDNSQAMIVASKYPNRVTLSNTLPTGPWDVILANWTLHFIKDQEQYLRDIFNQLDSNGILILSNKMTHSVETEELYYNFKRSNGVPEEEILKKKQSLVGVMLPRPLTWYFDILPTIGFSDVEVINTNLMFSTIYAKKR